MNDTNPQTFVAWTQATPFRRNIIILIFTFIALALIAKTVLLFKQAGHVGKAENYPPSVSVTGKADVYTRPDTLQFSININEEDKDAGKALAKASAKAKKAIELLLANGVEEKNIKTTNLSINDKYESYTEPCAMDAAVAKPVAPTMAPGAAVAPRSMPAYTYVTPCVNTKSKITGATVYQTLEVKIRNIEQNATEEKQGKLVGELAAAGIKTDGFTFTVFDLEAVKIQAREEAIKKAKADARKLASDLGVSLDEIIGFGENNDGGYSPYMSARAEGAVMDKAMVAPVAQLPTGEQKVTSVVNITYLLK